MCQHYRVDLFLRVAADDADNSAHPSRHLFELTSEGGKSRSHNHARQRELDACHVDARPNSIRRAVSHWMPVLVCSFLPMTLRGRQKIELSRQQRDAVRNVDQ